ncbi:bifunctional DNA primase/polymerase [Kitasatospora griseola]|uniref:bifunctional DNA primase/polymerase n=1 Tax=Kitasatospora griseola TaxID=2064 RepID=UPI00364EFBD7
MDKLFGTLRLVGGRRRTRPTPFRTATEYSERWGWTLAAGSPPPHTSLRCECAVPLCAAPNLHRQVGPPIAPGASAEELAARCPADAPLLLPTGHQFDVLDVPAQPGLQALVRLERMGTQVGPVLASPTGRLLFFVAPRTAEHLPDLLYRMGWDDASLDLACHGLGSYLAAPPVSLGALGPMRWLRRPTADNHPPEARLLLGTLAYACHRTRDRETSLAG